MTVSVPFIFINGTTIDATQVNADFAALVNYTNTTVLLNTGGTITGNLTVTGSITPGSTNGIVGTITNDDANAGSIGQLIQNDQGGSLANGSATNVTSVSLTPGDWDVEGYINFTLTVGATSLNAAVSLNSNSLTPIYGISGMCVLKHSTGVIPVLTTSIGRVRVSLATTTTVFVVGRADFASGTCLAEATIQARRLR